VENNKGKRHFFLLYKDAFRDPSKKDCKQWNTMQFDTRSSKFRQEVLYKGLIDNRCHSLEAVPERRAIRKLNAYFFLQKIKSECKYQPLSLAQNIIILVNS